MSILTSLFSGISGLSANGTAISVVGDNIANSNTVSFKASRVNFVDILSSSMNGSQGASQIGRGVYINDVTPVFSQGSFETTENGTDLAIEGSGFFMVQDQSGIYYTRAGDFRLDKDGYMVNSKNMKLQGFSLDAAGNSTGALGDLNMFSSSSAPSATDSMKMSVNVNSASAIPAAFAVANPTGTSNFNTAMTIYDSLGNSHLVTVYFRKSVETPLGNTWEWNAVVNGADTTSGNTEVQANGTLNFDNNGALSAVTTAASSFNFNGGAAQAQAVAFDFGDDIASGGTGYKGTTQFGAESATIFQSQNGYTSGSLKSISIDKTGMITGTFTNGQTKNLAIVALANFANPNGLTKQGGSLYAESNSSGQPLIGQAGKSGLGSINSNSLELSNVDLATEFVKLITFQRGFQANSKIITTTDEMLNDVVNLKR